MLVDQTPQQDSNISVVQGEDQKPYTPPPLYAAIQSQAQAAIQRVAQYFHNSEPVFESKDWPALVGMALSGATLVLVNLRPTNEYSEPHGNAEIPLENIPLVVYVNPDSCFRSSALDEASHGSWGYGAGAVLVNGMTLGSLFLINFIQRRLFNIPIDGLGM